METVATVKKALLNLSLIFFNLECNDEITIHLLFSWAAKINKFRRLVPKENQDNFIKKYSNQISKLRKLGIFELREYFKYIKMSTV